MKRIFVICEGKTELLFVRDVLNEAFQAKKIYFDPKLLGKPGHRGGNVTFDGMMSDIRNFQNPFCYITTFFDFYGLDSNFPGKKEALAFKTSRKRSMTLLNAFQQKLDEVFGDNYKDKCRIVPYVQMHEFEALLFSDPKALAESLEQKRLKTQFESICQRYETPEDINNSPQTAPSKQIEKFFPGYGKPTGPIIAAKQIGLETMRRECPLFNEWLEKLEKLEDL